MRPQATPSQPVHCCLVIAAGDAIETELLEERQAIGWSATASTPTSQQRTQTPRRRKAARGESPGAIAEGPRARPAEQRQETRTLLASTSSSARPIAACVCWSVRCRSPKKSEADAAAAVAAVNGAIQRVRFANPCDLCRAAAGEQKPHYENDSCAIAYARHMEQWLLEQPETLVVELAEAEAVARETNLSGETVAGRHRCLSSASTGTRDKGRTPAFSCRSRFAKARSNWRRRRKRSRRQEATGFLGKSLADFVKQVGTAPCASPGEAGRRGRGICRTLSPNTSELGDWPEALGLAEASLLLVPNQPDLERDAVDRYSPECSTILRLPSKSSIATARELRAHAPPRASTTAAGWRTWRPPSAAARTCRPGTSNSTGDFFRHRDQEIEPAFPKEIYGLLREIEGRAPVLPAACRRLASSNTRPMRRRFVSVWPSTISTPGGNTAEYFKFVLAFQDSISLGQRLPICRLQRMPSRAAIC